MSNDQSYLDEAVKQCVTGDCGVGCSCTVSTAIEWDKIKEAKKAQKAAYWAQYTPFEKRHMGFCKNECQKDGHIRCAKCKNKPR